MKAQTVDICATGTATINDTAGGATIIFEDCVDDDGNTINGTISVDSDTDGEEPFISTITFDNIEVDDLDCGQFTMNGEALISVFLDGSGTIDYSMDVDGPDGTLSINCTLSLDYTCPEFTEACGSFAEVDVCIGDDFRTDISCE
jgi:hypothetical protein